MKTSLRIKFSLLFILVFAGLVLARLFYWQVISADELAVAASKQHLSHFKIPASRGRILASDGFPLTASEEVFLVFAAPEEFQEGVKTIAKKLTPFLVEADNQAEEEVSPEEKNQELREKLDQPDLEWIPLQHKVNRDLKEGIEKLVLKGIGFEKESKRTYPEGTASAFLLGFVGSDIQGRQKGYFGLEGFYDLELRGHAGLIQRERDASGKPILMGFSYEEEERDGWDLLTTIDRTAQFIVEKNLKKGLVRYGAVSGSVVIMDPETGAVLAMVALPTYNPALYYRFEEELFSNPVISSSYEPGSTFKVLVMASAINEGVIEPETKCDQCSGSRVISGYLINTWNDCYFPDSTMTEVLVHSDNVGMVFVGEKLGKEKMFEYLQRFGFGQLTGVDLQGEGASLLRAKKEWGEIDLATASFGQGVAVTPIQMVRAVSSIANGGKLPNPYLVKGIVDRGKLREIKPKEGKRVIESKTAKLMTQMMFDAVDKGEAQWAKPEGFRIAGKTGTSQIPVAGHYDQEKTIASFIGFAPLNKPRFVMLVTLREPSSSPWGSETAAPLWFDIAKELFTYWGILPG